jgi:LmbE family N-acetylglucosaminyl deacetylase
MRYVDFPRLRKSSEIGLLFPGWKKGEKVAFFSPHDDDALLGAGYLISGARAAGGIPHLFVFCRGDAGYSTAEERKDIVRRRKEEALRAYRLLGVRARNIHFLGLPDFSLMARLDRLLPSGKGLFETIVRALRKEKISRVVFSSGFFEHWDHTAVFYAGIYTAPQAQDPILVDLGKPFPVRTYLAYSVWGDFEQAPGRKGIRADFGILADEAEEKKIITAIKVFSSQSKIIRQIVSERRRRKAPDGYLELYQDIRVRQPINYAPYFTILNDMSKKRY